MNTAVDVLSIERSASGRRTSYNKYGNFDFFFFNSIHFAIILAAIFKAPIELLRTILSAISGNDNARKKGGTMML